MTGDEDQYSDTDDPSEEDRALVERMRRVHDELHATRHERTSGGMSRAKPDFPMGIRPDGTVNRVDGADDD